MLAPNVKILPPNCDVMAGKFKMVVFNDGILGAVVYIGAVVVPNPAPNVTILSLTG